MGDILHNNRYPTDVESDDGSLPSRANTDDQIDAILENYQFTCKPELRLKFRTRCAPADAPPALPLASRGGRERRLATHCQGCTVQYCDGDAAAAMPEIQMFSACCAWLLAILPGMSATWLAGCSVYNAARCHTSAAASALSASGRILRNSPLPLCVPKVATCIAVAVQCMMQAVKDLSLESAPMASLSLPLTSRQYLQSLSVMVSCVLVPARLVTFGHTRRRVKEPAPDTCHCPQPTRRYTAPHLIRLFELFHSSMRKSQVERAVPLAVRRLLQALGAHPPVALQRQAPRARQPACQGGQQVPRAAARADGGGAQRQDEPGRAAAAVLRGLQLGAAAAHAGLPVRCRCRSFALPQGMRGKSGCDAHGMKSSGFQLLDRHPGSLGTEEPQASSEQYGWLTTLFRYVRRLQDHDQVGRRAADEAQRAARAQRGAAPWHLVPLLFGALLHAIRTDTVDVKCCCPPPPPPPAGPSCAVLE